MTKIELELNDSTLEQAKTHATKQHITVEKLFANILEQQVPILPSSRSSLGLFADEPDIMDHVMEMIRIERDQPTPEQVRDIA